MTANPSYICMCRYGIYVCMFVYGWSTSKNKVPLSLFSRLRILSLETGFDRLNLLVVLAYFWQSLK